MITEEVPRNWRGLQDCVARILIECGFNVTVEKKVRMVRGDTEIDVFAEEVVKGRKYVVAIECKHWRRRVPQTVVHAFRTVVAECGANIGYIVSSTGFQVGATAASELTNVNLRTWSEFQDAFELAWFDNYLVPTVTRELDPLMSYTEPILPAWFGQLTESRKKKWS